MCKSHSHIDCVTPKTINKSNRQTLTCNLCLGHGSPQRASSPPSWHQELANHSPQPAPTPSGRSHSGAGGPSPLPPFFYPPSNRNLNQSHNPRTFIQFNTDGVQSSLLELTHHLSNHKVKVAALQETNLGPKYPRISIHAYHFLKKDRPITCGGSLAFAIHESVPFIPSLIPIWNLKQ